MHASRRGSDRLDVRAHELRRNLTWPERRLWSLLRNRRLEGLKFRRQQVIGSFVVDFYCAEHQLVIEVDGESHVGRGHADEARSDFLRAAGLRVLRVTNDEVLKDTDAVQLAILRACGKPT